MLFVTDNAKVCCTFDAEATNFARRHAHLGVVTFFSEQLRFCASAANSLTALAWL
jgi:hypothetical protein